MLKRRCLVLLGQIDLLRIVGREPWTGDRKGEKPTTITRPIGVRAQRFLQRRSPREVPFTTDVRGDPPRRTGDLPLD